MFVGVLVKNLKPLRPMLQVFVKKCQKRKTDKNINKSNSLRIFSIEASLVIDIGYVAQ